MILCLLLPSCKSHMAWLWFVWQLRRFFLFRNHLYGHNWHPQTCMFVYVCACNFESGKPMTCTCICIIMKWIHSSPLCPWALPHLPQNGLTNRGKIHSMIQLPGVSYLHHHSVYTDRTENLHFFPAFSFISDDRWDSLK